MANELRTVATRAIVAYRETNEVQRTIALRAIVAYRETNEVMRTVATRAIVAYRILRTWENIPGAKKLWYPGNLEAADNKFYLREHRVVIGTGRIGGARLQLIADEICTVYVNGTAYITYTADEDNSPIREYDIPASMLFNGNNLFAFRVTPKAGSNKGILEYKITIY